MQINWGGRATMSILWLIILIFLGISLLVAVFFVLLSWSVTFLEREAVRSRNPQDILLSPEWSQALLGLDGANRLLIVEDRDIKAICSR